MNVKESEGHVLVGREGGMDSIQASCQPSMTSSFSAEL